MLNIYSYQNSFKVSDGKDKFCFRSVVDQIIDNEQLIKEIVNYNSTITEADIRAVLSVLDDRVKHFVNLGYKVELPFGYVFNKANGTVAKLNDGFTPGASNHRITTAFKFKDDAADSLQGLFLISTDKTETRIANYNRIETSILEAFIPSTFAAGTYEIKLVTKPGTERYEKCMFSSTIEITA